MSKIKWWAAGSKKYRLGVDHGILFPKQKITTENADKGPYTVGVAWNGLTQVTATPSGQEAQKSYADNGVYAVVRGAATFGGTIEAFDWPAEFNACNGSGSKSDAKGLYVAGQTRQAFGFAYREKIGNDSDGMDHGYTYHFVYNATCSPSEEQAQTLNESPELATRSWEFDTDPITCEIFDRPTAHIWIPSDEADPEKLAALLAIVEGSDSEEPRLPLPDEIYTLMKTTA